MGVLKHRPPGGDRANADRNAREEEQQPPPRGSKFAPRHL
jgi:hypothetical protein